MSDYARTHLDECCLRFMCGIVQKAGQDDNDTALTAAAFEKAGAYRRLPILDPGNHNLAVFQRSQELRDFHDDLVKQSRRLAETEMSFAQLAAWHIRERGYNKAVFRTKTLLSGKTYERIMANRLPNPDLNTVMAICLGLRLSIRESELLLEKAGYRLGSSPQHLAYHKLLSAFVGHSLAECNEVLEALDLSPITAKPRRDNTCDRKK